MTTQTPTLSLCRGPGQCVRVECVGEEANHLGNCEAYRHISVCKWMVRQWAQSKVMTHQLSKQGTELGNGTAAQRVAHQPWVTVMHKADMKDSTGTHTYALRLLAEVTEAYRTECTGMTEQGRTQCCL